MAQNSPSTRNRVTELTTSSDGIALMVTWEWNNGWNLVDSRRATLEEQGICPKCGGTCGYWNLPLSCGR